MLPTATGQVEDKELQEHCLNAVWVCMSGWLFLHPLSLGASKPTNFHSSQSTWFALRWSSIAARVLIWKLYRNSSVIMGSNIPSRLTSTRQKNLHTFCQRHVIECFIIPCPPLLLCHVQYFKVLFSTCLALLQVYNGNYFYFLYFRSTVKPNHMKILFWVHCRILTHFFWITWSP